MRNVNDEIRSLGLCSSGIEGSDSTVYVSPWAQIPVLKKETHQKTKRDQTNVNQQWGVL